jgi:hypothetical protein
VNSPISSGGTRSGESAEKQLASEFESAAWEEFAEQLSYRSGDIEQAEDFSKLRQHLEEIEGGHSATRLFYLATIPALYPRAIEQLGAAGLVEEGAGRTPDRDRETVWYRSEVGASPQRQRAPGFPRGAGVPH